MSDHGSRPPPVVDVLVVGGGPAGLTVASLLGTYGLRVALVEKNQGTSDEAKAISLDDESLRALQVAGLDEVVYPIIVPGTGTRYYDRQGRPLFHARGPEVRRHGHPFKNPFAQPDLERALFTGLTAIENVHMYFGTELIEFTQSPDAVTATVRTHDGETTSVTAQFMLGCDGGRSTVREQLGIDMSGRSFPELWLVADTLEDTHDERYGMHVGDPDRPHVIVAGLNGRCRYEFKLKPGEATAGNNPPFELVQRLVGKYRSLTPDQLERSVVYGFHAIIANAFRDRRCFLLGDAAHMMPPFAGQGLNSGIRDAMNLAWKVAAVVNGRANDRLLDTYEIERRPHAQATIDLSVRLGEVVMTSSRARARVRDLAVRTALRVPRTRQYLTEMRYRPKARFTDGFLATAPESAAEAVVGAAVPQTQVLDGSTNTVHRLDDLLGTGGALIGVTVDDPGWEQVDKALAELGELGGTGINALFGTRIALTLDDRSPRPTKDRTSIADVDGALGAHLSPVRGHFLLLRPDRVVAAAFRPVGTADAARALTAYTTASPPEGELGPQPAPNEKVY
jgi:3-(3-hydroxy-phenyl)propionate hydroxylase